MNNEGQGGRYLEEENIFFAEEKKNREGKGGRYLEQENTFLAEVKKYGEEKGGKYLEKENISFAEEKERGRKILRRELYFLRRRRKGEENNLEKEYI